MALNEAEKQKAISSPTVSWIRNLVTRFFEGVFYVYYLSVFDREALAGDSGIPQFMPMNTKRSKDFQCVARTIFHMFVTSIR